MPHHWSDDSPIYKQLEQRIITWVLSGKFKEGEAIPSVRKLSVDLQINHLTVAKSFQELVDQNIIEKRRGLGMFVAEGAIKKLSDIEKKKFFEHELPRLAQRLSALDIHISELTEALEKEGEAK